MTKIFTRPWGTYEVILKEKNYQVKRIIVFPHQKLSLQSHNFRSEHWIMVEGQGVITLDDDNYHLKKDDKIYIPVKSKHRASNESDNNLIFIEIQNGDYLEEDDIVRYEDIYNRV